MRHHLSLLPVWLTLLVTSGPAAAVPKPTAAPHRPAATARPAVADATIRPVTERFAVPTAPEVPDFRRHLVPLLGQAGCSGRACHGSFQGKGGFRLSLFGYDFAADHQALLAPGEERVLPEKASASLLLAKPTMAQPHGGGQRIRAGTWQYHLLRRWIEGGARPVAPGSPDLTRLEVSPPELVFPAAGKRQPLRVIAHWSDGSAEDVTPLCRYQTNDESVAEVDEAGVVTGKDGGDTHVVAFYDSGVAVAQVLRPLSAKVGAAYPKVAAATRIDALVGAKLQKLGVIPSVRCTDTEFLRRVSLDLTGTLPAPAEVLAFAADPTPGKRAKKVEELLARPTYAARWTTKLCEITGNSPKQFDGNGPAEEYARQWYAWTERRVRENMPYDQLVAGIILGRSRPPGRSYRAFIEEQSAYYREQEPRDFTARETMPYYWAKHTSRTPEERALNFTYTFLGVRLDCAQCHKHPFDRWTQSDFKSFTAFFEPIGFGIAQDAKKEYQELIDRLNDQGNRNQRERARLLRAQKGEIVPWNEVFVAAPGTRIENGRAVPRTTAELKPRLLGGDEAPLRPDQDPLLPLVEWMRRKDNPYFARVFVNRVWAEYFGAGIVNPPDDLNLANPPSNKALLDYLTTSFIEHGFDMKRLHGEIVSSDAYQRSLDANDTNRLDERNFSRRVARRLPAEQLFDAITQATGTTANPERVTTDLNRRAIGPDGGALVGARSEGDYASRVFGRSPRDTNCDCSASDEPNLLQAIYLQNDKEVLTALERKAGWLQEVRVRLNKSGAPDRAAKEALISDAYLRTLSRQPTAAETTRSLRHFDDVGDPVEALHDLLWALLNTREFVTNH